jgi:hypothetical protein
MRPAFPELIGKPPRSSDYRTRHESGGVDTRDSLEENCLSSSGAAGVDDV